MMKQLSQKHHSRLVLKSDWPDQGNMHCPEPITGDERTCHRGSATTQDEERCSEVACGYTSGKEKSPGGVGRTWAGLSWNEGQRVAAAAQMQRTTATPGSSSSGVRRRPSSDSKELKGTCRGVAGA
ncbi:uncharacterized protein LOC144330821 [Macaca mulatta]